MTSTIHTLAGLPAAENLNQLLRVERQFEDSLLQIAHRLETLRQTLPWSSWKDVATEFKRNALHQLFCECPFHGRAYNKPRGYAGDAPTLDFIYGLTSPPSGTSFAGRRFFDWALEGQSCRSVRARKDLLAVAIDDISAEVSQPRILSVACGHLREALKSRAIQSGQVGELIGFDQDAESLDLVRREYAGLAVTPFLGSVRSLLSGKAAFSGLDLIYSAGLYDYLADPVATRLNQLLFAMLRPGGKLLVANFAPNLVDIGFMEASMDWWLIYRDERACEATLGAIDPRHPRRFFRDEPGNVVFAEVTKLP